MGITVLDYRRVYESANFTAYKRCALKCMLLRQRSSTPFEPVFNPDFRNESINCNVRVRLCTREV